MEAVVHDDLRRLERPQERPGSLAFDRSGLLVGLIRDDGSRNWSKLAFAARDPSMQ